MKYILILSLLLLSACRITSPDARRGKAVYYGNCIGCHGDPNFGSVGPAIINADKQLLYFKVIKGTYPPGYKPKHKTKFMPIMPELEKEIEYINEYLEYKRNFD